MAAELRRDSAAGIGRRVMKKLQCKRGETILESLVSILVVTLIMLFLSTSIVTAAKINRKLRDTDVTFEYGGTADAGSLKVTPVTGSGSERTCTVTITTTNHGYRYYRYGEGNGNP